MEKVAEPAHRTGCCRAIVIGAEYRIQLRPFPEAERNLLQGVGVYCNICVEEYQNGPGPPAAPALRASAGPPLVVCRR